MEGGIQPALPLIVVLDWDGTIAGRVDFQSQRFAMQQHYKKFGMKGKVDAKVPKAFQSDSMLIRPGFSKFIHDLTEFYGGNIHFFVYTASERTWANKEIQWVEKAHGIKFQRPIFTRDDCTTDSTGSYRKSIQHIYPRMLRSIGKSQLSRMYKDEILKNRLLIIDNNAVYTDTQDHLLICPHYNYMVFENLLEDIPVAILKHPQMVQYIYNLVNLGLVCPFYGGKLDINQQMYKKYEWLALKCKHIAEENKVYSKDVFFKYLKKLIMQNGLKVFTPNVVKQLQQAVWKKAQETEANSATAIVKIGRPSTA